MNHSKKSYIILYLFIYKHYNMNYRFIKTIILISIAFLASKTFASEIDSLVVQDYNYEQIEEVCKLHNLKYLKIDSYKDTILPSSIGQLSKLEYLEINFSKITSLPSSIGRLINLKTLIIANGNVNIIIPAEIGNLVHLKELDIYNFHFNSIPTEIGNLVNLESTMLCGDLSKLPSSLSNCTKIKSLYLADNKFNHIPRSIFKLKQLQYLDFENNDLLEVNNSIKLLSNLTDINLSSNCHLSKLPQNICMLRNLKTLNISNTKISFIPFCLANNDSLERIKMCKTLINHPQKMETMFGHKIEWEWNCLYLKHSLINYSEIYGKYALKLKNRKDTVFLNYTYSYNEPDIVDEEFQRTIVIKMINKNHIKLGKIYPVSNTHFIISTNFFSVWNWSNSSDYTIDGYLMVTSLSKKKCEIYLNLSLSQHHHKMKLVDKFLLFKK